MALTHGKPSTYKKGCRCQECTKANTDMQRLSIERRRARVPYEHGNSAYGNWHCRCTICKEDHRRVVAELHEKRRGSEPPAHGTMNGYQHYSCRCDACKMAASDYRAARKEPAA